MAASGRSGEVKTESQESAEFPFFNAGLKALSLGSGKAELIKLLNNDCGWTQIEEKFFLKIIKARIVAGKAFSIPTAAEILKTYDYNSYKIKLLLFLAAKYPKGVLPCTVFFNFLDAIATAQLTGDEKLSLARSFYYCLNHPCETAEIKSFIESSINLKKKTGIANFFALYKNQVMDAKQSFLSYYIKICQLIINLPDTDSERLIRAHYPDLKALISELETADLIEMRKKFPEEKTEEIINRWARIADSVKFPLSLEEVNRLKIEYAAVEVEAKTLTTIPATELAREAKIIAGRLAADPIQIFRLVAILREAMRHEFKNYPYPEQVLSVLALLHTPASMKGRVAKILTGEGKSRTIAMLAALGGLQNRCVDIITSNRYLAIRDQAQFAGFFRTLGVTSSHICHDHPERKDFDNLINFATHHDIEFSILNDETYHHERRYTTVNGALIKRPFHDVWIDEVDVMLLDTQRNSARIAMGNSEEFFWVYHPLIQFLKSKTGNIKLSEEEIVKLKVRLLTPEVVEEFRMQLAKVAPRKEAEREFADIKIIKWLESAIKALHELEIDRNYTIKTILRMTKNGQVKIPQIIIIDSETTGRSSGDNCRWPNGLHEILEIINDIPPGHESLTCAAISHFSLFERYDSIGGLTGTVGAEVERDELLQTYKVGSFDVPPRFPSRRVQEVPLYFATYKEQAKAMAKEVKKVITQGRPVLVIFNTIKESNQFSSSLKSWEILVQVINEKQTEDEEYLISRAGHPSVVTVATYTAGRGTDIILTREALNNGGLHVIFGNFPSNERPEEQGFGRAGRQGQVGSCRMILCEKNKFIQILLKNNSLAGETISLVGDEKFIEKLQLFRKKDVENESRNRRVYCQIDALEHRALKEFWQLLQFCRKELDSINMEVLADKCSKITSHELPEEKTELPTWIMKLKDQSQILLMQQFKGNVVDWKAFLKELKEKCLDMTLKTWAKFFTSLADDRISNPVIYEKTLLKKLHQFINDELRFAFHNPIRGFLNCLSQILKNNSADLLLNKDDVTKLAFFIEWENKIKTVYASTLPLDRVARRGTSIFQMIENFKHPEEEFKPPRLT